MDSDSFFGFDPSLPVDEEDLDDDDFDALNDETFGSAAVGGDWEENHKQLSSLTEAERLHRTIRKDVEDLSEQRHGSTDDYGLSNGSKLQQTLECLSLENGSEKKRLFERSVDSSPLTGLSHQTDELSMSPGNNIWSPTNIRLTGLENLPQHHLPNIAPFSSSLSSSPLNHFTQQQQSNVNGLPLLRSNKAPTTLSELGTLAFPGSDLHSAIKTVSEIEDELKRQHSNPALRGSKPPTMRVDDLERELCKHTLPRKVDGAPFPSVHLPSTNFHSQTPMVVQSKMPNTLPSPFHQQNPSGLRPPGNILGLYHCLNPPLKGVSPGFGHPGPNSYQSGIRPGNIFYQASHRVGGNKAGFFHSGNPHVRTNAHHKPNIYERQLDHLSGAPHTPHHDKRGPQNCDVPSGSRGRVRRDSDAEWEEWHRVRQIDEYAGLMTPREKNWLRVIQTLQLPKDNPYQDDYYFVMHKAKQQCRREEETHEMDGLQLQLMSEHQHRFGISNCNRDGLGGSSKDAGYEPPKLENSLGKLQVASVNAPRKIIDLQVVHLDPAHPTTSLQRDMRRHRHLLLHIEKLYTLQIELDDLERKIRALPDCPTRDSFQSKCRQLVARLWTGLTTPHESFVQLLCIRKSKTLAARLLNWVGQGEIEHFLATVVHNLPLLTKRDSQDRHLPLFWPFADRFFSRASSSMLLSFAVMMGPQLKVHKQNFIPASTSKLGLSMVLSLLLRGEVLRDELENDPSWHQFLADAAHGLASLFAQASSADSTKMGSPLIHPLPSVTLAASAGAISAHFLRYRDSLNGGPPSSDVALALEVVKDFEAHYTPNANSPKSFVSPSQPSYEPRKSSPHGSSHFYLQQQPSAIS